jgi:hypothetical protein
MSSTPPPKKQASKKSFVKALLLRTPRGSFTVKQSAVTVHPSPTTAAVDLTATAAAAATLATTVDLPATTATTDVASPVFQIRKAKPESTVITCDSSSSSSNNGKLNSSSINTAASGVSNRRAASGGVLISGSSDMATRYESRRNAMAETLTGIPLVEYFAVYQQSTGSTVAPIFSIQSPTAANRPILQPADIDKQICSILAVEFTARQAPVQYKSAEPRQLHSIFGSVPSQMECCYGSSAFVIVFVTGTLNYFLLCVQLPAVLEERPLMQVGVDRNTVTPVLTYHRRALVMMSSQPILRLMWNFFEALCSTELTYLWCKYAMHGAGLKAQITAGEKLYKLMHMLCTTPMAEVGATTDVKFAERSVRVKPVSPEDLGFPSLSEFTITAVLRFDVRDLMLVFKHLICQYSAIFKGTEPGLLSSSLFGFISILGAFRWTNSVFSVLTRQQLEALQSPVPYVAAVLLLKKTDNRQEIEAIDAACNEGTSNNPRLVVDVDTCKLSIYPQYRKELPCADLLSAELSRPIEKLRSLNSGNTHTWIVPSTESLQQLRELHTVFETYSTFIINSIRRKLPFTYYVDKADIENTAVRENISHMFPEKYKRFYQGILASPMWSNVLAPSFAQGNLDEQKEGVFLGKKIQ